MNKPSQISVWLLLHVEDPGGLPCPQEAMLCPIQKVFGFLFFVTAALLSANAKDAGGGFYPAVKG